MSSPQEVSISMNDSTLEINNYPANKKPIVLLSYGKSLNYIMYVSLYSLDLLSLLPLLLVGGLSYSLKTSSSHIINRSLWIIAFAHLMHAYLDIVSPSSINQSRIYSLTAKSQGRFQQIPSGPASFQKNLPSISSPKEKSSYIVAGGVQLL